MHVPDVEVEDLETANEFIQNLRGLGYPVCLDDFGAGAASFQYLSAIDVDVVKIDGPVVKNAEAIERGRAFLTALASFCRELGVETIAEITSRLAVNRAAWKTRPREIGGWVNKFKEAADALAA